MKCQELKNFIESILPHERDAAMMAAAQQHASTCPACAKEMADMLHLEAELAGLAGMEAEDDLSDNVMRRIGNLRSSPVPRIARREWHAVASIMAGLLVLAAAYWYQIDWSNWSAGIFHLHVNGNWNPLSLGGSGQQFQLLLPTLIGAALIVIGLTWEMDRPADEIPHLA